MCSDVPALTQVCVRTVLPACVFIGDDLHYYSCSESTVNTYSCSSTVPYSISLTQTAGLTLPVVCLWILHMTQWKKNLPCSLCVCFHHTLLHILQCKCAHMHTHSLLLPTSSLNTHHIVRGCLLNSNAFSVSSWRGRRSLYPVCRLSCVRSLLTSLGLTSSLKSLSAWSRPRLNKGCVRLTPESVNWERGWRWWARWEEWQDEV